MSLMEQFADPTYFEGLSMGERLTGATVTMCMGLGITFIVLIILWACIAIMAKITNRQHLSGSLADVLKDADILIGVSKPGIVTQDMIRSMAKDPIVFVMANPVPEIMPNEAKAAGAAVVGTGRSDFPNQVNNVIAFPGIFRGALDCGAPKITEQMKEAAARAIASVNPDEELTAENVLPDGFNPLVDKRVAEAVMACYQK